MCYLDLTPLWHLNEKDITLPIFLLLIFSMQFHFGFLENVFFLLLIFRGMQKLMAKYALFGVGEIYRRANIRAQIRQMQEYIPEMKFSDVIR